MIITIDYDNGVVKLKNHDNTKGFSYHEGLIRIVKEMDVRRFDWNAKVWSIGLSEVPEFKGKAEQAGHEIIFSDAYNAMFNKAVDLSDYNFLFDYQKQGVKFLIGKPNTLLADECGLGKTVQSLTTIKDLVTSNPDAKALILAPLSSLKTWIEENKKFTQLEVVLVRGNSKDKVKKWSEKANVYITNHDGIKTKEFPDWEWDIIVLDEASRAKNFATQFRKKLGSIKSKKRIALTATPIENKLEDLYSIANWVDKNILPPYGIFRQKFMKLSLDSAGGRTFYVIDGYKNLDRLKEIIAPIYLRREKSEVGEQLPDLMFEKIWLSFNSNEKDEMDIIYNDIKEKTKEKHSVIGEIVKARVLCAKSEQKAFELLEIVKGVTGQVIVFSEFLDALNFSKILLEDNNFSCGLISGGVKQEDRDRLVDDFQNSKIKVLFLQTKTGGYGLNLQKASTVVFLNRPYTLATEEQAYSRAHRTGQKNKVQVYYLLVENSFEHRVNKILEDKGYLTNEVIVSSLLEVDKNGEN